MKIAKRVLISLAILIIGGGEIFATNGTTDSTSTEKTSNSSQTNGIEVSQTYSKMSRKSDLAKNYGNTGDNVKIIGSVVSKPLVTSLYYNSINITNDAKTEQTYIYDADWPSLRQSYQGSLVIVYRVNV